MYLLAWVLACSPTPPPPPPGRTVLLVSLDTTRADAMGAYGATPSPSPVFDRLASAGLLAEEAQTVTPLTLPAHSSLLTGRTPDHHGVRDNSGFRLPDSERTLAERFSAAGWRTGAFVSAIVLDEFLGVGQGFDTYRDDFDFTRQPEGGLTVASWPSSAVVDKAVAWLDTLQVQDDAFLWVHLYDAHRPYHIDTPGRFDIGYADAIYTADAQVGRLLAELEARGRHQRQVIAIVGDHGESNGDHGETSHGQLLYRSTTAVPLAITGDAIRPGTRLSDPVSIVDVAPTLLELSGLPADGEMDGTSLLREPDPRPRYSETWYPRYQFGFSELRALQTPRWRYILAPREELYDWRADPGELHDVAAQHPDIVRALRRALGDRTGGASAGTTRDADIDAALQSLGYLTGAPTVPADTPSSELPDPKDAPNLQEDLERVVTLARTRPPLEGARLLEEFLGRWPHVTGARTMLALAYERGGDAPRALQTIRPLLEASPTDVQLLTRVAQLELTAGDTDASSAHLDQALQRSPTFTPAITLRAESLRRAGDLHGALQQAEAGLAIDPSASALYLLRGSCRLALGDWRGAEVDLRESLTRDPASPDARFMLAQALLASGPSHEAERLLVEQLKMDPSSTRAHATLGSARAGLGDWQGALEPLRVAAEDPSLGPEPCVMLADTILHTGGAPDDALQWLDEAEARGAPHPDLSRVRAAALLAKGDVQGAIRAAGG